MSCNLELDVDDITIQKSEDKWFVRIAVGGYMYFDTPVTDKDSALTILINVIDRLRVK